MKIKSNIGEIKQEKNLGIEKKDQNSLIKEFKRGGDGRAYTLYTGKHPRILLIGRSILINLTDESF